MENSRLWKLAMALACVLGVLESVKAQQIEVASLSIGNADSVTYTVGEAQTISITLGLSESDGAGAAGTGGSITKISVYFTNNGEFESATTKSTAVDKTFGTPLDVTAGVSDDKTIIADETVDLTIDAANCADYTHVCVVITATGDTTSADDDGCLPFGATVGTGAGTKQCTDPPTDAPTDAPTTAGSTADPGSGAQTTYLSLCMMFVAVLAAINKST